MPMRPVGGRDQLIITLLGITMYSSHTLFSLDMFLYSDSGNVTKSEDKKTTELRFPIIVVRDTYEQI